MLVIAIERPCARGVERTNTCVSLRPACAGCRVRCGLGAPRRLRSAQLSRGQGSRWRAQRAGSARRSRQVRACVLRQHPSASNCAFPPGRHRSARVVQRRRCGRLRMLRLPAPRLDSAGSARPCAQRRAAHRVLSWRARQARERRACREQRELVVADAAGDPGRDEFVREVVRGSELDTEERERWTIFLARPARIPRGSRRRPHGGSGHEDARGDRRRSTAGRDQASPIVPAARAASPRRARCLDSDPEHVDLSIERDHAWHPDTEVARASRFRPRVAHRTARATWSASPARPETRHGKQCHQAADTARPENSMPHLLLRLLSPRPREPERPFDSQGVRSMRERVCSVALATQSDPADALMT